MVKSFSPSRPQESDKGLDLYRRASSLWQALAGGGSGGGGVPVANGDVWITDSSNDLIHQLDASDGSSINTFAMPEDIATPSGIAFGPDGSLWYTDAASGGLIYKVDPSDGTVLDTITPPSVTPSEVAIDSDGTVWVVCGSFGSDDLYHIDPSDKSTIASLVPPGTSPSGLAFDGEGNLWFSSSGTLHRLDKTDASSLESVSSFDYDGVAFDSNGYVLAINSSGNLEKLDPTDGYSLVETITLPSGAAKVAFY